MAIYLFIYFFVTLMAIFCSPNMLTCFYSVRLTAQVYLPNISYLKFHGFKLLIPYFEGR